MPANAIAPCTPSTAPSIVIGCKPSDTAEPISMPTKNAEAIIPIARPPHLTPFAKCFALVPLAVSFLR